MSAIEKIARGRSPVTFDIVSYTPPPGWAVEAKATVRTYTKVDNKAGTFCRVILAASVPSTGEPRRDFDAEWRDVAIKQMPNAGVPAVNAPVDAANWKVTAGGSQFVWQKKPA